MPRSISSTAGVLSIFFAVFVLSIDAQSEQSVQESDASDLEWMVYDKFSFDKNELCSVLNCRRNDLCLVKNEDALCVRRGRLSDVAGKKTFFKVKEQTVDDFYQRHPVRHSLSKQRSDPWRQRGNNQASSDANTGMPDSAKEWDPNRVRQKLDALNRKIRRKQRNRFKSSMANRYDMPSNFRELSPDNHSDGDRSPIRTSECNQHQLIDVGDRFLQWFSDVHQQERVWSTKRLRHVQCAAETAWMFIQLDGDEDGRLSAIEQQWLGNVQYEPCITPFLNHCDYNKDKDLSAREWCQCFHWVVQQQAQWPCFSSRRRMNKRGGQFMPRCTQDGYFQSEQCHNGYCWCSTRQGVQIPRSQVIGRAICEQEKS